MKRHVQAIGAAIGYALVFYAAGGWDLGLSLVGLDFLGLLASGVFAAIMPPLYFFVRNRIEKRWTLRVALLLSSALFFCVTWAVADGFADEATGDLIFASACFLETMYIGILLLDLLTEAFQLLVRRLQNIRLPVWILYAKVSLIDIKPNRKAVFAALLYTFCFYVSSFVYDAFSGVFDFYSYSFCFYIGLTSLLYFFVRKRVEKRWLFRGIVFLSRYCFTIFCVMFSQTEKIRNISLIAYFITAAFLLFDLFAELLQEGYRLLQYSKRRIQNRHA